MRPPPFISVESITTLIGNNSWPQCSLDSHYLDNNIPRDPAPVSASTGLYPEPLACRVICYLKSPQSTVFHMIAFTWRQKGIKFPQAGLVAQLDTM